MINLHEMVTYSVILPAGGTGSRFGSNKLIANLAGQPVIVWSINAFLQREDVAQIVIATSSRAEIESAIENLEHSELILSNNRISWAAGGISRAHTIQNALKDITSDYIAIHDAARPLVSQQLIDAVFAATVKNGAAGPALPVNLTIKEIENAFPGAVRRTVPRANLYAMQTPQCMKKSVLEDAFKNCPIALDQVTDDLQLLELAGKTVYLVPGEDQNLKITTPFDLRIAHAWLQS